MIDKFFNSIYVVLKERLDLYNKENNLNYEIEFINEQDSIKSYNIIDRDSKIIKYKLSLNQKFELHPDLMYCYIEFYYKLKNLEFNIEIKTDTIKNLFKFIMKNDYSYFILNKLKIVNNEIKSLMEYVHKILKLNFPKLELKCTRFNQLLVFSISEIETWTIEFDFIEGFCLYNSKSDKTFYSDDINKIIEKIKEIINKTDLYFK